MTVEYKDWRGTPIEVGSLVVYPGRVSSSMWMNEGEVVELLKRKVWYDLVPAIKVRRTRGRHYTEGTSILTSLDRVTVIPQEK